MQLTDLPQFTVSQAEMRVGGWRLYGEFDQLQGVQIGRSWLFVSLHDVLIGDLEALDLATRRATFNTHERSARSDVRIGTSLPWLDGYWQAHHVALILDPATEWLLRRFEASDALETTGLGHRVLSPAVGAVLQPGEIRIPLGGDHEHCCLCNTQIRAGMVCFVAEDAVWLCEPCHHKYAACHDIGFVG